MLASSAQDPALIQLVFSCVDAHGGHTENLTEAWLPGCLIEQGPGARDLALFISEVSNCSLEHSSETVVTTCLSEVGI